MNCLLISLRDRLSYVTQSDRNLWKIKIRQIASVTCRFVRDPFCVRRQKNQNSDQSRLNVTGLWHAVENDNNK